MFARPALLTRPIAWLTALGLVAVLVLGLACGGGDGEGDGGAIGEDEASRVTNQFLTTTIGLFTGDSTAQQFIDLFAPECREDVDVQSLEFVLAFIQGIAPELQGVTIEEIDSGPLVIEQTSEGTRVSPQDPNNLRVKVDGQFVPATEFFADAGFEANEDQSFVEPILLVSRDGQTYVGDCSQLEDLSGGFGS